MYDSGTQETCGYLSPKFKNKTEEPNANLDATKLAYTDKDTSYEETGTTSKGARGGQSTIITKRTLSSRKYKDKHRNNSIRKIPRRTPLCPNKTMTEMKKGATEIPETIETYDNNEKLIQPNIAATATTNNVATNSIKDNKNQQKTNAVINEILGNLLQYRHLIKIPMQKYGRR